MNIFQTGFRSYSPDELNRAMLSSYLWMALGLAVSAAVSFLLYVTDAFYYMLVNFPSLALILCVVQIAIAVLFSTSLYKRTEGAMKALFLAYSVTLGISMTSLAYVYEMGTIAAAFLVSAVYFLCLVAFGMTTKRSLASIGTICIGGLLALIITQALMMLLGVGAATRMMSIVGLLLFTGITVWDVQKLPMMLSQSNDVMTLGKLSIFMAFELYLDFVNIFLYILRLLGMGNKRR
jgi:hypothetical protein